MFKIILVMMFNFAANNATVTPEQRLAETGDLLNNGYYQLAQVQGAELSADESTKLAAVIIQADAWRVRGEYQLALKALESVAELVQPADNQPPNSTVKMRVADWYTARVRILQAIGEYATALTLAQEGMQRNPDHLPLRWELGQLLERRGEREQAIAIYQYGNDLLTQRFPDNARDAHYAGLCFYRYSVLTQVNNLTYRTKYVLQEVWQKANEVMELNYWPARLAIADLLREKYNLSEALTDYQVVLKQNPHCVEAYLGMGYIALENWSFEYVETYSAIALDINPHCAEAYVLLAACRMLERRYDDALAACEQALVINPEHLAALSYRAAAQIMAGYADAAKETEIRVEELQPRCVIYHFVLGQQFANARQFPESEQQLKLAIEYEPTNPAIRNELGMMYMQWGHEPEARATLDASYKIDQFNAQTVNTLNLLDQLESFTRFSTDHFEFHYQAGPDAVLAEYFGPFLEELYAELKADYNVKLPEKTIIEIFPDHRAFGVRIHGKPWIATIGACTGRVIAMDAPRKEVQGVFNFAGVLRHEFTHTITLAATNNRIPHWFTEGLAVLQEDQPRSWNWRQLLVDAIRRHRLFKLEEIDWGFMRPRFVNDRQLAYAQSEWMCEYLIEKYGYGVIEKMLENFRQGGVTRTAIPEATGLSMLEFDRVFAEWASQEAADWGLPLDPLPDMQLVEWLSFFHPHSPILLVQQAQMLLDNDQLLVAQSLCDQAQQLAPQSVAVLKLAAEIHLRLMYRQPSRDLIQQQAEQARQLYEQVLKVDPHDADALAYLANWANEQNDYITAVQYARQLKEVQPLNPTSYQLLSAVYLKQEQLDAALPELLELALQDEHDPDVPRQIGYIYREQNKLKPAAEWYRRAVHIDPYHVATHQQLGRLLTDLNDHPGAIREYLALTLLEPRKATHFNELAFAYQRAGNQEQARQTAEKAVALDPNSSAKTLLPN
ncbi:MAG: Lipopolysaccharide assembly protein B [Phycisphaerae bacterium]|nr:Lipopolysaccharide assembly protein B [Phycisphaerae bacterium]